MDSENKVSSKNALSEYLCEVQRVLAYAGSGYILRRTNDNEPVMLVPIETSANALFVGVMVAEIEADPEGAGYVGVSGLYREGDDSIEIWEAHNSAQPSIEVALVKAAQGLRTRLLGTLSALSRLA